MDSQNLNLQTIPADFCNPILPRNFPDSGLGQTKIVLVEGVFNSAALKWPRAAGPFFWRRLVGRPSAGCPLSSRQGFCLLLIVIRLWACGQRVCVVHMSIGCWCRAFAPDGHWRAIAERLMKAARVVEGKVFADAGFRFEAVGIAPQIDVLVFQRAPDAFDEDVVPASLAAKRAA